MAVDVKSEPAFNPGKPKVLFRRSFQWFEILAAFSIWDIHPDGMRFLMMKEVVPTEKPAAAPAPPKINIVLNWTEELKQRVPAGK